ncbi:MAG: hypothetical protein LIP23_03445, partial [Planctomycetes bacterium]|nr:hypothetical protein [Planctomycetota bacterium]
MSRAGKIGYIAFYCCVAVAFASVLARIFGVGADRAGPSLAQADPALEQYVLQFYRDIDDGNYDIITAQAVEGKWRKGEEARQYFFAGILDADEFRQHLLMDYGKDGWQIRFVTLR